jgi:hypothetical protein
MVLALSLALLTLGIYLLRVARWHLRTRPTLVGGGWDLGWLLLGASGLVVLVIPQMLATLHENWRALAVSRAKPGILGTPSFWHGLFFGYFALVVLWVLVELWFRLGLTHLYNLRSAKLRRLLLRACLESGLKPELDGDKLRFGPESTTHRYEGAAFADPVWLSMKAAPRWAYAQLRWSRWDHPARAVLEQALERVARRHAPRDNAVGTAFLTASTCVLVFSSGLSLLTTFGRLGRW